MQFTDLLPLPLTLVAALLSTATTTLGAKHEVRDGQISYVDSLSNLPNGVYDFGYPHGPDGPIAVFKLPIVKEWVEEFYDDAYHYFHDAPEDGGHDRKTLKLDAASHHQQQQQQQQQRRQEPPPAPAPAPAPAPGPVSPLGAAAYQPISVSVPPGAQVGIDIDVYGSGASGAGLPPPSTMTLMATVSETVFSTETTAVTAPAVEVPVTATVVGTTTATETPQPVTVTATTTSIPETTLSSTVIVMKTRTAPWTTVTLGRPSSLPAVPSSSASNFSSPAFSSFNSSSYNSSSHNSSSSSSYSCTTTTTTTLPAKPSSSAESIVATMTETAYDTITVNDSPSSATTTTTPILENYMEEEEDDDCVGEKRCLSKKQKQRRGWDRDYETGEMEYDVAGKGDDEYVAPMPTKYMLPISLSFCGGITRVKNATEFRGAARALSRSCAINPLMVSKVQWYGRLAVDGSAGWYACNKQSFFVWQNNWCRPAEIEEAAWRIEHEVCTNEVDRNASAWVFMRDWAKGYGRTSADQLARVCFATPIQS